MSQSEIGILGLGSRSTQFYINKLNTLFNEKKKGYSTFPFLLYNTNFDELNPFLPNNFVELEPVLSKHLTAIGQFNIRHWIIPNITLHETFDRLSSSIQILHPVGLTITSLKKNNHKKAVIIGSRYTMESNYLKDNFTQEGIELIMPTEDEKEFIDSFRKKIYAAKELESDVKQFSKLKQKYSESCVVVISCTELSLFTDQHNEKEIDMAMIQINEALKLVD